jgi:hypothetical protein
VVTVDAIRKHHRFCVLIRGDAEGMIQATLEAKRIAVARRIEKSKTLCSRRCWITLMRTSLPSIEQLS